MSQPSYESGLLFTKAHKAVRDCVYTILNRYDLTPSYWAILGAAVQAPEGIRLANVARQMDVKAPLITMLSNDLIKMDLITRVPHHTDGRAKLLSATPKGKKLATQIETELSSEIARLMHGISAADAATFQKSLETIIANSSEDLTK
jgi:MarR family transcriptional regulator for hemolysin